MWNWIKKHILKIKPQEVKSPDVILPVPPLPEIPADQDDVLVFIQINPSSMKELTEVCTQIKANQQKYAFVQSKTGVPYDVIAACHYREASLDFSCCLANGERIIGTNKKTKLVPAGRGPFATWEDSAIDALLDEAHKFPAIWDLNGKLAFCEAYNGLGYKNKGVPSPYVWAGTSRYKSGLYVADGKYSSTAIDKRLGCAAIIKGLRIL